MGKGPANDIHWFLELQALHSLEVPAKAWIKLTAALSMIYRMRSAEWNVEWYEKQVELFKVYSFPRNWFCGFPPATESQVSLTLCGAPTSLHPLFLESSMICKWYSLWTSSVLCILKGKWPTLSGWWSCTWSQCPDVFGTVWSQLKVLALNWSGLLRALVTSTAINHNKTTVYTGADYLDIPRLSYANANSHNILLISP